MLDPEQALDALPGARAVVPVHLYGQIAPLEAMTRAAAEHDCVIIEDAAHAHGATRNGRGIGSWGRAAATSFYPSKNLGAYGDAGAVLTIDDELGAAIRSLRDHGAAEVHGQIVAGCNSRLDTLQAVVLRAKLGRLAEWNELRRTAADRYGTLLADLAGDGRIELPSAAAGNTHVWHLYVVRVPDRDGVLADLRQAGIGARVHYEVPLHREPAFAELGDARGSFPVAERLAHQIVSLPLYPGITAAQHERVADAIAGSLGSRR
jgi:dTDP-4-amino-4,6-dideoxygalactose transaminase